MEIPNLLLFLLLFFVCFNHYPILAAIVESDTHNSTTTSSTSHSLGVKRITLSIIAGLIAGFLTAISVAFTIRIFVLYLKTTPVIQGPVVFSPKIDPRTLQSAFEFENDTRVLGSSLNGTYYATALDNGLTIAIKRLEQPSFEILDKAFKRRLQQDLHLLARLKNRHLMSLRAYIREENDRFCLVYDFMANGSLEDAMNKTRQNQLQMGWDVRLRIAIGIIKGLKFLHFECNPSVLHYNLKPSNVLLDHEFEPKLTDFGLAKLMPKLNRPPNAYGAPECTQSCQGYTDKSDVFSFGVILAVLLTGRDPCDPLFAEAASGGSLSRWLRQLQQAGEARQALDKIIVGQENEQEEMLMAVRIAVACMSDLSEDRPSSDELVPMLSRLHSF